MRRKCYGLPVRLPYIVVTCARMFRIKRVCCDPPYRVDVFTDILSVHDTLLLLHLLLACLKSRLNRLLLENHSHPPSLTWNRVQGQCHVMVRFNIKIKTIGRSFEVCRLS